ncbi:hypothetical protein M422DRAFT_35610, partial [Sphaerobolus stellatus SS14]
MTSSISPFPRILLLFSLLRSFSLNVLMNLPTPNQCLFRILSSFFLAYCVSLSYC